MPESDVRFTPQKINKNVLKALLLTVDPLDQISRTEMKHLLGSCHLVQHPKRTTIFSETESVKGAWILMSGRAEIFKHTSTGRRTAIECITPKQWMGTLCRLGTGMSVYPCTAVAAMDSTSILIEESAFQDLLSRCPKLTEGICKLCSQRLSKLQDFVGASLEPADKRIIKTLFRLSETTGLTIPFTKREISEHAATTPETAIRILSLFQKRGWVSSSRDGITLKDVAQLKAYLNDDGKAPSIKP